MDTLCIFKRQHQGHISKYTTHKWFHTCYSQMLLEMYMLYSPAFDYLDVIMLCKGVLLYMDGRDESSDLIITSMPLSMYKS